VLRLDQEQSRAVIADLTARVDRLTPVKFYQGKASSVAEQVPPYWYCERANGAGALAAGVDWDTVFDAEAVVKYPFRMDSHGQCVLIGSTTTYPIRAIMEFDSDSDGVLQAIVHSAGNNVQLKVNGSIVDYGGGDYTVTTAVSLYIKAGRNIVRFAHDGASGIASLEVDLVNGATRRFVEHGS
jgi:hypothetical protein